MAERLPCTRTHADAECARPGFLRSWQLFRNRFDQYSRATEASISSARAAWDEIQGNRKLRVGLLAAIRQSSELNGDSLGASVEGPSWLERFMTRGRFSVVNAELYTLIRCLRPNLVVETGVAAGISSTLILQALELNGNGKLVSIDLPNYTKTGALNADGVRDFTALPEGSQPGWLIPPRLRHRWTLVIGDSRSELPKVFREMSSADFFFHDSEHSIEVMNFEFRSAWSALRLGGILYSDDVLWNSAFPTFCACVGEDPNHCLTAGHRGLLKKRLIRGNDVISSPL